MSADYVVKNGRGNNHTLTTAVRLECPSCGSEVVSLATTPSGIRASCNCGDYGTVSYFTPVAFEREEKVIQRTFAVERTADDQRHAKAINACMVMLINASMEENLDIDWSNLRILTSPDEAADKIDYLVICKAWTRPAPRGGQASGLIKPTVVGRTVTPDELLSELGFDGARPSAVEVDEAATLGALMDAAAMAHGRAEQERVDAWIEKNARQAAIAARFPITGNTHGV